MPIRSHRTKAGTECARQDKDRDLSRQRQHARIFTERTRQTGAQQNVHPPVIYVACLRCLRDPLK